MDNISDAAIKSRNVIVKVFENELEETTRSVLELEEWLEEGHLVVAHIIVPDEGERRTSLILRVSKNIFGTKFRTISGGKWFRIKGFEKPIIIKMVKFYFDDQFVCEVKENDPDHVGEAYRHFMDAYQNNVEGIITADVFENNSVFPFRTTQVMKIDWDNMEFVTKSHSVYKMIGF